MKTVTLNFREVAVDGLPEKSCEVITLSGQAFGEDKCVKGFYSATNVPFSKKFGKFNAYDAQIDESGSFSDDVLFWIPISEVNDALLKEAAPNAD